MDKRNISERFSHIVRLFSDAGIQSGDKLELLISNPRGEPIGVAFPGYLICFKVKNIMGTINTAEFSQARRFTNEDYVGRNTHTSLTLQGDRDLAIYSFGEDTFFIKGYRLVEKYSNFILPYTQQDQMAPGQIINTQSKPLCTDSPFLGFTSERRKWIDENYEPGNLS